MKLWSKKYISCQSCNTEEWKHKSKGYCIKCYDLMDRRNALSNWDINNSKSIVPIKGINPHTIEEIKRRRPPEVLMIKEKIIAQIDRRIFIYQEYNNSSNLDAIHIEHYLSKIYSLVTDINKGGNNFHGRAMGYNDNFNLDQRKIIIKDLICILISCKFRLNWDEIFD
jgi:hypothetical protein